MEFNHKHQLLGFLTRGEYVMINDITSHVHTAFNFYERSDAFIQEMEDSQGCYVDAQEFNDWLFRGRYVNPIELENVPKLKLRRYRNYPLFPTAERIFQTVGQMEKELTDDELLLFTTMDIFILTVINDDNELFTTYGEKDLGPFKIIDVNTTKERIRKCAGVLRELEYLWNHIAREHKKKNQPTQ